MIQLDGMTHLVYGSEGILQAWNVEDARSGIAGVHM